MYVSVHVRNVRWTGVVGAIYAVQYTRVSFMIPFPSYLQSLVPASFTLRPSSSDPSSLLIVVCIVLDHDRVGLPGLTRLRSALQVILHFSPPGSWQNSHPPVRLRHQDVHCTPHHHGN